MTSINLGFDVSVIFEDVRFFKVLTSHWPAKVVGIIYHDSVEDIAQQLKDLQVRCDKIVAVHNHDELLAAIMENKVQYFYRVKGGEPIELPQSLKVFRIINDPDEPPQSEDYQSLS